MFANNYYTLVAGFREYALDAETKGFDIEQILTDVEESLSAKDWREVQLLFAYYDCENLVALRNGGASHNRLGRLSSDELAEELLRPTHLPEHISCVLRAYAQPDGEDAETVDVEQPFAASLFAGYYAECATSASRFLREWAEADRTLRNVTAAIVARERGLAVDTVTVGGGEIVEQLHRSSAADFGLRGELQYVDSLIAAVGDESNLLEKERKIDLIRWSIASELSQFDYFDLNAVMCYLVKVCIVARWSALDRKTGRVMFERLMAELDGKELVGKL
ncbi:MAG: DUF2764 family protein [Alistipes sp.]|nr:DUF2764 family protein [Alistipes sp.]